MKQTKKLKNLVVKDHILSAVPAKMVNFLKEQTAGDLHDLESKGIAYFDGKTTRVECWYCSILARRTTSSKLDAAAVKFTITKLKNIYWANSLCSKVTISHLQSLLQEYARIARLALILQDYKFVVTHIIGNINCLADLLSRL